MKRELETILERDVLPVTIPEFPTVRRLTMMVSSIHARDLMEKQQKAFTQCWDPLFIGYLLAVYFHTCEINIKLWTTQAKKMRKQRANIR